MNKFNHELILCIVNEGFSDAVMDAAREAGAKGGTVLHANGTANQDAQRSFGIVIEPNKDMVMILVPSDIRSAVLKQLYDNVGLHTPGQGIAFSLPVDSVVGIGENK